MIGALRNVRPTTAGGALFATSLAGLGLTAPREAAFLAGAIGLLALLLFLATRNRIAFIVLIVLTTATFGCALFGALMLQHVAPLALSAVQIVALALLEGRQTPDWIVREVGSGRVAA
jgi:hypothetical protein